MMQIDITKRKLSFVDKEFFIQLFNNPLIKRHMPLLTENFDDKQYNAFIASKDAIWEKFGFGPLAYYINNDFAGWGGLQPDEDDFELALVLSPKYWGYGRYLYHDLIKEAFDKLNLASVTILFPLSRTRIKWIFKIGFVEETKVIIEDKIFIRFRLKNGRAKIQ